MSLQEYAPTSILDITSSGFRKSMGSIKHISLMTLPLILVTALMRGFTYAKLMDPYERASFSPEVLLSFSVQFLANIMILYLFYCIFRYVRDTVHEQPNPNPMTYLIPQTSLLGMIGIAFTFCVLCLPCVILIFIGLLLLIVPGILLMLFFWIAFSLFVIPWFYLLTVTYLSNPKKGLTKAFQENWKNLSGNYWRTAGLSFLIWLVQTAISLPLGFINGTTGILVQMNPSFIDSLGFSITYSLLFAVAQWFYLTIAVSGVFFVYHRYYFDLKIRRERLSPVKIVTN